jgi:hypothetical protein
MRCIVRRNLGLGEGGESIKKHYRISLSRNTGFNPILQGRKTLTTIFKKWRASL